MAQSEHKRLSLRICFPQPRQRRSGFGAWGRSRRRATVRSFEGSGAPSSAAHLPGADQRCGANRANRLAQEIRGLIEEAHRLRGAAERQHDVRAALKGVDVALRAVELYRKATGELHDSRGPNVTVQVSVSAAEGISEAVELLLLLADRQSLVRIAGQLQERAAELESSALLPETGQDVARAADNSLPCSRVEVTSG